MADFNKVGLDVLFSTLFPNIKDLFISAAKLFDGTADTNIPDGTIRWSSSNRRLEKYEAGTSSWVPLLDATNDALPYEIRVAEANHADDATYSDTAGDATHADNADLATNATNLGGTPAADYLTDAETGNSVNYNVGTNTDQIPLAQHLSTGAYTTVGTAAGYAVGTGGSNLPTVDMIAARPWTYLFTTSITLAAGTTPSPFIYAPTGSRWFAWSSESASHSNVRLYDLEADGSAVRYRNYLGSSTVTILSTWVRI